MNPRTNCGPGNAVCDMCAAHRFSECRYGDQPGKTTDTPLERDDLVRELRTAELLTGLTWRQQHLFISAADRIEADARRLSAAEDELAALRSCDVSRVHELAEALAKIAKLRVCADVLRQFVTLSQQSAPYYEWSVVAGRAEEALAAIDAARQSQPKEGT